MKSLFDSQIGHGFFQFKVQFSKFDMQDVVYYIEKLRNLSAPFRFLRMLLMVMVV